MGKDTEKQKKTQADLNETIARLRDAGELDKKLGATLLRDRLCAGDGYYWWSILDKNEPAWQLRLPRQDLEDEGWLKSEAADFLHVCDALGYLLEAEKRDKEASSKHVGYVRDKKGELKNLETYACTKCKAETPSDIATKVKMMLFVEDTVDGV